MGMGAAVFVVGIATADINLLRILGVIAGMFVFGPIVGLTLPIAENYPVDVRATGMGFIVGTSPWLAPGFVLDTAGPSQRTPRLRAPPLDTATGSKLAAVTPP